MKKEPFHNSTTLLQKEKKMDELESRLKAFSLL